MYDQSLDVLILTKNEQANIAPCLDSVKTLGSIIREIIVIDDFSDDETTVLAEKAGARVIRRKLDNFAAQRNFALENSAGAWVFFLDADERLTPELARAIESQVVAESPAAGSILRRSIAFGRPQRFGPLAPDRVVRLFPRTKVRWTGLVHERPEHDLAVNSLGGYLEHHTYTRWSKYLEKWQKYASLWALEAQNRGKNASVLGAVIRAAGAFLKMFLVKLGILGGPVTWALCWYYSGYTLSKYLLLAESKSEPPAKE
jgi:glycosyltransferase involved in cell wall biosynthesis